MAPPGECHYSSRYKTGSRKRRLIYFSCFRRFWEQGRKGEREGWKVRYSCPRCRRRVNIANVSRWRMRVLYVRYDERRDRICVFYRYIYVYSYVNNVCVGTYRIKFTNKSWILPLLPLLSLSYMLLLIFYSSTFCIFSFKIISWWIKMFDYLYVIEFVTEYINIYKDFIYMRLLMKELWTPLCECVLIFG